MVYVKVNIKSLDFQKKKKKNSTKDFQNRPPFERLARFYVSISGNLNIFNTLTLNQVFCRTKTFFKKIGKHFLAVSTKIENATCPYKTAVPEAKIRPIKWEVQNLTLTRKRVFLVATLLLWKFGFSLSISY